MGEGFIPYLRDWHILHAAVAGLLYAKGEMASDNMVGMVLFLFDLFISIESYYGQITRLTVTAASLDRIEEVFEAEELHDFADIALSKDAGGNDSLVEYSDVALAIQERMC